jgi:hypothetical protein
MTVALETATSSERLNLACREAYAGLRAAFAGSFATRVAPERAAELAGFVVAAIEGGVMLSRTDHSGEPLRRVAAELERYLETAM